MLAAVIVTLGWSIMPACGQDNGIAPASVVTPMTGNHHLLGDVDKIVLKQPIPSDYNPIHLGIGQSEVVLMLKPGTPALQLLVDDHVHMPP